MDTDINKIYILVKSTRIGDIGLNFSHQDVVTFSNIENANLVLDVITKITNKYNDGEITHGELETLIRNVHPDAFGNFELFGSDIYYKIKEMPIY